MKSTDLNPIAPVDYGIMMTRLVRRERRDVILLSDYRLRAQLYRIEQLGDDAILRPADQARAIAVSMELVERNSFEQS